MSAIIEGLIFAWRKNQEYGPRLVADLGESQMVFQPVTEGPPANHPAWVFSHLNVYLPVIAAVIEGVEFEDPKAHRFGMQSKPESDQSLYANKQQLVEEFVTGHDRIADLLENSDRSIFEGKVLLPRWQEIMPTAAFALPYLMLNHENMHLGQVSAWRRIQNLPCV